jgi:hypothetical protein
MYAGCAGLHAPVGMFATVDEPRRDMWPHRHGLRRGKASGGFVTDGDPGRGARSGEPDHGTSVAQSPCNAMEDPQFQIISVAQARHVLTNGDLKSDVAFQHDVNRLLASLEDLCDVFDAGPAAVAPRG